MATIDVDDLTGDEGGGEEQGSALQIIGGAEALIRMPCGASAKAANLVRFTSAVLVRARASVGNS